MKKIKFKAFSLGVILTMFVELLIFVYFTCNIQVKTTYLYNPQAVVEMLGNYSETTK